MDSRIVVPSVKDFLRKFFSGMGDDLFEARYARAVKIFGRNFKELMATRVAAVLAVVGIIISGIEIANPSTPLEIAMSTIFLLSEILDLVATVGAWSVSAGCLTSGGIAATICSAAGPLAIVAAMVGAIIMLVIMFTSKPPPDPIEVFADGEVHQMKYCAEFRFLMRITKNMLGCQ